MSYSLEIRESLDRELKVLVKKDKVAFNCINKEIDEILSKPYHFKPLKSPLQIFRRVQIGNFVLIYSIDQFKKAMILEKYEHHDKVYKI